MNDIENGERLYLIALFSFLIDSAMGCTTFPWGGIFEKFFEYISVLCVLLKLFLFGRYKKEEFIVAIVLFSTVLLIQISTGYKELWMWSILFISAKDVDFKNILRVYILSVVSVLFMAIIASIIGAIPNLVYVTPDFERNSFGIIYPTDFAAMVFYLMLTYLYLEKDALNLKKLMICLAIDFLVFKYCHTRLDCITMFISILGFAFINGQNQITIYFRDYVVKRFGIYAMPICACIMFGLSYYYYNTEILIKINELLSARLTFGYKALHEYPWNAFGTYIQMVGNGGTTLPRVNYFFIDCSYLNVFLRFGYVFFAFVVCVHIACCKKYKDDAFFVLAVIIIAINCMVAHHMVEYFYNIFPLAYMSKKAVNNSLL